MMTNENSITLDKAQQPYKSHLSMLDVHRRVEDYARWDKERGGERERKRERDLRAALFSKTLSTHRALSIWKLSKRIRYKLITFMSALLNISSPMLWLPLLRYVSFQSLFARTASISFGGNLEGSWHGCAFALVLQDGFCAICYWKTVVLEHKAFSRETTS